MLGLMVSEVSVHNELAPFRAPSEVVHHGRRVVEAAKEAEITKYISQSLPTMTHPLQPHPISLQSPLR